MYLCYPLSNGGVHNLLVGSEPTRCSCYIYFASAGLNFIILPLVGWNFKVYVDIMFYCFMY